ncbi:MAG: DNA mismatch repair protein MutS, partial [Firmicutes bacterium]|nr:DNA mismatch repair protein MutS [Bacillota bacterium]
MPKYTPMMEQYLRTKEEVPDCLLMYRLGDFYECFFEDAKTASRELDLVLTGRDCGMPERAPMCGVPYHAVEGYLQKLVEKGYKVAICEQMEDPKKAVGLVKREITRIVTPGTNINADDVGEKRNNYIVSANRIENGIGLAVCDITTGEFAVTEIDEENRFWDEIARYHPAEILLNEE